MVVQISTYDSHYYLVCDSCYGEFVQAQTKSAREKLAEF